MSGATCAIFMITNSRTALYLGHRSDARKYGSGQSRHLGGFENPGIDLMAFSGTRMSDLQDLHRRVPRGLFSFAPSIVGKLA